MSESKVETPESAGNELEPEFYDKLADSFQYLAQSILRLREAEPVDYQDILKEMLLRALNDDDKARVAFINQLVELVDPAYIKEVVAQISAGECRDVEKKSPFREALEKLNAKWRIKIENKLTWISPSPTGWSERRIQANKLKKALEKPFTAKNGSIYPDHELIKLVEEIVRKGKHYYTQFGFDCGFNGYLVELTNINKLRCNGTLKTCGNFYAGQESLMNMLAIQNVKLENRLADILRQVAESQAKQCTADQWNTSMTAEENEELSRQVADLKEQNEELASLCQTLTDDNREKDETIASLKSAYERLLERMGSSLSDSEDERLSPDSSPSSVTYTSASVDSADVSSDGEELKARKKKPSPTCKRKLAFDFSDTQDAVVDCKTRFQFDQVTSSTGCQREVSHHLQGQEHLQQGVYKTLVGVGT